MKRKTITVLMGVLMYVLTIVLAGCGAQGSEIEGEWTLQEMEIGSQQLTMEELANAVGSDAEEEISVILTVEPNGKFMLVEHLDEANSMREDDEFHGTYTEEDGSWIFHVEGQNDVRGTLEEGRLILHDMDSTVETKMILEKN